MVKRLWAEMHTLRCRQILLVIVAIVTIYLLTNLVCGRVVGGFFGNYALPALLWGLMTLLTVKRLNRIRPQAKRRHLGLIRWLALIAGVAGVMGLVAMGILDGFGRSPYDHSFRGIIINFVYLSFLLAGMEYSRAWLLSAAFSKRPVLGVAVTGLMFSFFWFPLTRLLNLPDMAEAVKFAGGTFLPALSESLLASYLAFLGGPLPAIIYRGTLLAFHWFSPVLPNLNWILQALVGTFIPVFGMVLVYQIYRGEAERRKRRQESESPTGWIVTSAVSVLIIWFAVGVFSIFPTVIITGSMSPAIQPGDVAIVKRITPEEVRVGDVIQFREEHIRIAHRVVAIEEEDNRPVFRTKGDANENVDTDPVLPEQVVGKIVYVVPKAGWITIALRGSD